MSSWTKAWPSKVKEDLRKKGIKDRDIATLESYSSIEEFKRDPKGALKAARADEVLAILKSNGLI